jgi:hypothetical protein
MAQPVRELTGRSYIWSPGADMEDFTLQLDFPLHSRLGGEPYAVKTGRSDISPPAEDEQLAGIPLRKKSIASGKISMPVSGRLK